MPEQFPDNKYLIQVVQPVDERGYVEDLRVDVYEMLELNRPTTYDPSQGDLRHIRFVDSFQLSDRFGHNTLSLDQITEKLNEMVRNKTS